jgi:hypothetical protein
LGKGKAAPNQTPLAGSQPQDVPREEWIAEQIPADVHWDGISDVESEEEDCEFTEGEDEGEIDAMALMLATVRKEGTRVFDSAKFKYQRGRDLGSRQKKRKRQAAKGLEMAAVDSRPLDMGFLVREAERMGSESEATSSPNCWISREEMLRTQRTEAIRKLEKKLASKKTSLIPQNMVRYQAVLAFMRVQQSKKLGAYF